MVEQFPRTCGAPNLISSTIIKIVKIDKQKKFLKFFLLSFIITFSKLKAMAKDLDLATLWITKQMLKIILLIFSCQGREVP